MCSSDLYEYYLLEEGKSYNRISIRTVHLRFLQRSGDHNAKMVEKNFNNDGFFNLLYEYGTGCEGGRERQ